MRLLPFAAAFLASSLCDAFTPGRPASLIRDDRPSLQDIVTWDNQSLFINGERIMIFSGEIHPYRLPVPSLWVDVLEKIRALGLNAVSVYLDWAQLEGKPGDFSAEGVFDYGAFFDAAKEVGLYVIARPGPYINAEVSGGGFPGWIQRVKGHLRTGDKDYLAATDNYMANIARIIADAQITNGGPVILYQPENEYSGADGVPFPDPDYFQYVIDQARNAGIVVPLISNDASPLGHNAPGSGKGAVDVYGHDGYPLGFDCANPDQWGPTALPTNWRSLHLQQSPTTPYSIPEFQGGSFDPWGGWGFDQCERLTNHEQVRVFNKNNLAAGVAVFNLYMIFGGTNWGNLGHPGGYTSYDYAAAIREDRRVDREKYSELKLEAHFLQCSPGYLVATPANGTLSEYSPSSDVAITALRGDAGSFFVVRHADYQSTASTRYTLKLPTSNGIVSIPQLGGSLALGRRDSKIHVADYPVGDAVLLYSTAEIFTWHKLEDKTVLVVYGGPGELHELAIKSANHSSTASTGEGVGTGAVKIKQVDANLVAQWETKPKRQVFEMGGIHVYALDRNSAYNYWAPRLSGPGGSSSLIVNGPYLVRSASVSDDTLHLRADFNASTAVEVIGVPRGVARLAINDDDVEYHANDEGNWVADVAAPKLDVDLPDLQSQKWWAVDSLPEIKPGYDDSAWTAADLETSNNSVQPLVTPVSLYASDYGFHAGALVYRGRFTAQGDESEFYVSTQGGSAFGSSAWLDDRFLGSWKGTDAAAAHNSTYTLPRVSKGDEHVLTVLVDNMGLDENWIVGPDETKHPRGILDYRLGSKGGSSSTEIAWKLTGNLGGEDYADRARGPLNEGGLFAERQGYHQPKPPVDSASFKTSNGSTPFDGLASPGVTFYATELTLDIPSGDGWDVPLTFRFANDTETPGAYRAWLYVNGFQFGRYVSNVGPQTAFPVPEGILDYGGHNWIGLAVWALESGGAKVPGLTLEASSPIRTGRKPVELVDAPVWEAREGAY